MTDGQYIGVAILVAGALVAGGLSSVARAIAALRDPSLIQLLQDIKMFGLQLRKVRVEVEQQSDQR